jgi:hypothetical protein
MLDAIPSIEPWSSSRKWLRLPKITSRTTSIDHGSPSTSVACLIGQHDLGCVAIVASWA